MPKKNTYTKRFKTTLHNMSNQIKYLVVDLFAGAGGVTLGFESSGVAKVVAAVNHDPQAIASHAANHPGCFHFIEDIRSVSMVKLTEVVNNARAIYPHAQLVLWASLECTHFSQAKGGQSRDEDSRTLAYGLIPYITHLNPDLIMIENVKEFESWGPLIERTNPQGKVVCVPEHRTKGREYMRWITEVQSHGYSYTRNLLNAADYGAPQSRVRFFGIFHRPEISIQWPVANYRRAGKQAAPDMFGNGFQPWKPVKDVLDLQDIGTSIFNRRKALVDKSLRRIIRGIQKFGPQPQIVSYYSPGRTQPIENPAPTITTIDHNALMQFGVTYYGNGMPISIEDPSPTVMTHDRFALISAQWLHNNYTGGGQVSGINEASGTLTTVPKQNLCTAFIVNRSYASNGSDINKPCPTVIATQKSNPLELCTAFIVNPQFDRVGSSLDEPAPTVIASRRTLNLSVQVYGSPSPHWEPQPTDTDTMRELRKLMSEIGIYDIFLRMLKVVELKRIQGFPDDYVLMGRSDEQKKFIGNAVPRHLVEAIALANAS
jgi:DNA (cytosine-5)-methyltransferase 1